VVSGHRKEIYHNIHRRFAPTVFMKQAELAFLRRKLMDLKVCVVVASTDSGALNMFNKEAATGDSRSSPRGPWVNLCTRLPQYVPGSRTREALESCMNQQVKKVLELCIQSRPFFASVVDSQIVQQGPSCFKDILPFLERTRGDLVKILRNKRAALSQSGCYGYVVASLLAGAALIDSDTENKLLLGGLTTKNWAYLVGYEDVLRMRIPERDEQKRARLDRKDHYMFMSVKKDLPTFVALARQAGVGDKDILHIEGSQCQFECNSFFPLPTEDFLLYLVLAGSPTDPGLYLLDNNELNRVSVATLVNLNFKVDAGLPGSINNPMPVHSQHEALVMAAFYTACNAGALSGCTLELLVTRFVAELLAPSNRKYPNLTPVDPIPFNGLFHSRFVFSFDTTLPQEVHQVLKSVQTSRPQNRECVDGVTYLLDEFDRRVYQILLEAKSTTNGKNVRKNINDALQRQDLNANVSFIVVDKYPKRLRSFNLSQYRVLDRSNQVGGKVPGGAFRECTHVSCDN
jgi:hypothetical protein